MNYVHTTKQLLMNRIYTDSGAYATPFRRSNSLIRRSSKFLIPPLPIFYISINFSHPQSTTYSTIHRKIYIIFPLKPPSRYVTSYNNLQTPSINVTAVTARTCNSPKPSRSSKSPPTVSKRHSSPNPTRSLPHPR